jgi:hypothetical protein
MVRLGFWQAEPVVRSDLIAACVVVKQFPCRVFRRVCQAERAWRRGHFCAPSEARAPDRNAVTVARPCNSYRASLHRTHSNCRRFSALRSAWILRSWGPLRAAMQARLIGFFSDFCVQNRKEFPMATSKPDRKLGATRRHKAARPIQSRTIGRRPPKSRYLRREAAAQSPKDEADRRTTRVESASRPMSGADDSEGIEP